MREFIRKLKDHRHLLTRQEIKTLKGQAISGNIEGASKGLAKILKQSEVMTMGHRKTRIDIKYGKENYKERFRENLTQAHRIKREGKEIVRN